MDDNTDDSGVTNTFLLMNFATLVIANAMVIFWIIYLDFIKTLNYYFTGRDTNTENEPNDSESRK